MDSPDVTSKLSNLNLDDEGDLCEALKKHFKLQIILAILRNLNVAKLEEIEADNRENVTKVLRNFHARLSMDNNFRLDDFIQLDTTKITYRESKAIKMYVVKEFARKYKPTVKLIEKIYRDHTDYLEFPSQSEVDFIALEQNRQELTKTLIELKSTKLQLLSKCVERRYNEQFERQLQLALTKYKDDQVKCKALTIIMKNEFLSRTKLMIEAIRKIEADIDEREAEK